VRKGIEQDVFLLDSRLRGNDKAGQMGCKAIM